MLNQKEHKDFVENKFKVLRQEAIERLDKIKTKLNGIMSPVFVDESAYLLDMVFKQIAHIESMMDYMEHNI